MAAARGRVLTGACGPAAGEYRRSAARRCAPPPAAQMAGSPRAGEATPPRWTRVSSQRSQRLRRAPPRPCPHRGLRVRTRDGNALKSRGSEHRREPGGGADRDEGGGKNMPIHDCERGQGGAHQHRAATRTRRRSECPQAAPPRLPAAKAAKKAGAAAAASAPACPGRTTARAPLPCTSPLVRRTGCPTNRDAPPSSHAPPSGSLLPPRTCARIPPLVFRSRAQVGGGGHRLAGGHGLAGGYGWRRSAPRRGATPASTRRGC